MDLILIGIGAAISTLIGGYFALYFKDRLHLVLGYSAGAVIGVAMFDLIPEAIDMGSKIQIPESFNEVYSATIIMSYVALGFALYLLMDRFLANTFYKKDHNSDHEHEFKNGLGPISLVIHSLLDGLAIGLAYNVDIKAGIVVAIAVLLHDFSDGINTVNMGLTHNYKINKVRLWLLADAIVPTLGIIIANFLRIPNNIFVIILAIFGGFFLYIGASELIPESQHRHPHFWTTFTTILGMLTLYFIISFS